MLRVEKRGASKYKGLYTIVIPGFQKTEFRLTRNVPPLLW